MTDIETAEPHFGSPRPLDRLLNRMPGTRSLSRQRRESLTEIARFLIVGGMNWIVDFTVFNVMRVLIGANWVLVAKVVAVGAATLFSWVVNRRWTFAARATDAPGRELSGFVVVNLLGMAPPLVCLWISHHLLGLTSVLADNISANVIGLVIGTILRYAGYKFFVFTGRKAPTPHQD